MTLTDLSVDTHHDCRVQLDMETARADSEFRRAEHLALALDSNCNIGAAVGLIMAEHSLSETDAFTLLVTLSQHENRKLRDLAIELLARHQPTAHLTPAAPSPRRRRGAPRTGRADAALTYDARVATSVIPRVQARI